MPQNERPKECEDCGTEKIHLITFYATFGHGQPGFPGYLQIDVYGTADPVTAEFSARQRVAAATDNRWCGLYPSLEDLHPNDRIFRGHA